MENNRQERKIFPVTCPMKKKKLVRESSTRSHLTLADRSKIEFCLKHEYSVRFIAKELDKQPSSILREIQKYSEKVETRDNDCVFLSDCVYKHVCGNEQCNAVCSKKCRRTCHTSCPEYQKALCDRLKSKPPHVCNGCVRYNTYSHCHRDTVYYNAEKAHKRAMDTLREKRAGFDLTLGELEKLNEVISPLVKKGQSPYHIAQSIKDDFDISISTIYRLINSGELDARDVDLREKVSRKPRNSKRRKMKSETIRLSKIGHVWKDFLDYMDENDTFNVQMDCVEGTKEDRAVLLTLHWPDVQMQLAFIMDNQDPGHVVETLDKIETTLGAALFKEMFPVILTDNGQEFTDITGMERSCFNENEKRTKIFFCEPNRSDEKGACENNHKLIRTVIPKGTSLEPYVQSDITLMMNHVNSYRRKKQFGRCAYDSAMEIMPEDFFVLLGLEKIPDTEVILAPALLRHRRFAGGD